MTSNNRTYDKLKEEIELMFSDYSFNIKIEEIESYVETDEKAWNIKITPLYSPDIVFEIHVELMEDVFKFEYSEDNYEELTEDRLFKFMFFEALAMVKRYKDAK